MSSLNNKIYCKHCDGLISDNHLEIDCLSYYDNGYSRVPKLFTLQSILNSVDRTILVSDSNGSWYIPNWIYNIYKNLIRDGLSIDSLTDTLKHVYIPDKYCIG